MWLEVGVGDLDTHLVSTPVPSGHDGQAKGHPGPREVPCIGVSEHVHGIGPWQVAGCVGNRLGRDGPRVGYCQLPVPANLLESWWGWAGQGQVGGWGPCLLAPTAPHFSSNASDLTFPHFSLPSVWKDVEGRGILKR